MSLPTPNTRKEQYLNAIATGNAGGLPTPITREEEYLDAIAKSGGGSGEGDMKKSVYDSDLDVAGAGGIKAFVNSAVAGKVDKVEGKGLSTNDYSDTEKGKVADNTAAIGAIVNENGCCNIAVHNCKSTTIEGATFTVNADSSITATAPITGAWQGVASTALFKLKGGITYKLTSGLPATSGFFMQLRDENSVDLANTYQVTEATYTPLTDMNCKVAFLIHDGYSMTSDETLYPMIYDARLKPTGYVPYAMTNRELTDAVTNDEEVAFSTSYIESNHIKIIKRGKQLYLTGYFRCVEIPINGTFITITDQSITSINGHQYNVIMGQDNSAHLYNVSPNSRQITITNVKLDAATYSITGTILLQ